MCRPPAVAPTITGAAAGQTSDRAGDRSALRQRHDRRRQCERERHADDHADGRGTLADGTGFSGLTSSGDVYTLTGSASALTSELDALVFMPAGGQPNTSATTSFALSDASSAYKTPATDDATSVNVSTPAVAPTITGAAAGQTLTAGATDRPFATVTIGDANSGASDTLTITLTGAGTLADGAAFRA